MANDEKPVAESKSALNLIRGIVFGGGASKDFLEFERKRVQGEISKLIMIIEADNIDLNDEEIMDINEEINRLLAKKNEIEINLRNSTGLDFVERFSKKTRYFGKAKQIQEKRDSQTSVNEKRRTFPVVEIKETPKEEIVEKIIHSGQPAPKAAKKIKILQDDED